MNETTPDQADAHELALDPLRIVGELLSCLDAAGYDPKDTQQLQRILAAHLHPQAGRPLPGPDAGDQALRAAPSDEALLESLDIAALIARSSLGTPSARRIRSLTPASQIAEILRRRDLLVTPGQQSPAGRTDQAVNDPRPEHMTAPLADKRGKRRGRAGLIAAGLLVGAGALTDTLAFKNTLELALPQVSGPLAWAMAAGATSMALVAAAILGISLAIRRRTRGHRGTRLLMTSAAVVWIGLGLAMFLVRWLDTSASAPSDTFGGQAPSGHPTPLVALFFAAIYLVSGACTIFEAERLYNPEYYAFRRLRRQYRQQAQKVAEAEAIVDRACAALDLHEGELDREDHRRQAAIADRKALAAEAANYARILVASMMRDPAKTGLTEAGPGSELPPALSTWGADDRGDRYMRIPEIDRWRAVPFDMVPTAERGAVLQRVQQITESLEGAIDEGTGSALDLLIESWAGSWIATMESEYVDHCAVISVHRGQAAQWLTDSKVLAQHEREKLEQIRAAYVACCARLADEQPGPAYPGAGPAALQGYTHQRSPGSKPTARRSLTSRDTKPPKPIFYGPTARLADWSAGRRDGNAAIPDLTDPRAATTPYLEIRRRHFLDRSDRERRRMLNDLEPVQRQLTALRQDIADSDAKVTEIRKRLDAIPAEPYEAALRRRNAVEQDLDQALVRARRQREHDARRTKVLAEEQQAVDKVRALRVEEARLAEMIAAREQILATRVRQLHEHTLRRCGTYQRHLVRKHPVGAALIPFLNPALPTLPDWTQRLLAASVRAAPSTAPEDNTRVATPGTGEDSR